MKLALASLALGVVAFGVALLVRGGAGDLLSLVGLALIGLGSLGLFGRLYQDKWDRLSGSGSDSRHEMSRGAGPF